MILEAVKQSVSSNMNTQTNMQILNDENSLSFFECFEDATKQVGSDNKIRWDHLGEEEQKCEYFAMAKDGVISYNGATFVCDYDRNELQLGDCSDRSKCLTISLTNGGTLVVNRDNLEELKDAITMFSPEDQLLIMRAIMVDKKAQEILRKIEEESFVIGGEAYTIKEWSQLIERFDKSQEEIKMQLQEEVERQKEEQKQQERLEEEEDLILRIL